MTTHDEGGPRTEAGKRLVVSLWNDFLAARPIEVREVEDEAAAARQDEPSPPKDGAMIEYAANDRSIEQRVEASLRAFEEDVDVWLDAISTSAFIAAMKREGLAVRVADPRDESEKAFDADYWPDEYEELRQLAEAAKPGESERFPANAAYIAAATPEVVLRLIDAARQVER